MKKKKHICPFNDKRVFPKARKTNFKRLRELRLAREKAMQKVVDGDLEKGRYWWMAEVHSIDKDISILMDELKPKLVPGEIQ
jgi:hypothetical protein